MIKRKGNPLAAPEKQSVALNEASRRKQRSIFTGAKLLSPQAAGNLPVEIKKYRRMFNSIQDIYYEIDSKGIILELSPSVKSCLGLKRKALLGCPIGDLFVDLNQWKDILKEIKKKSRLRDCEVHLKTRADSSVSCSMNIRMISSNDKPARRLIGLIRDISERKKIENKLRESKENYELLSITDGLTNLFNSRHFYNQLSLEMERSRRYRHPLSLILLDVDNFKKYNDTFGHKEGDTVLVILADVIRGCLRGTDTAYRYGGEEFVVILPETTKDQGKLIAERIRKTFKKKTFHPRKREAVQKTVSLGVVVYSDQEDATSLIKRVDKNMYKAKSLGKDQTCCL
ncbi:sensor domain-containing diguanylate cyclase [bacterium]|nr:MAG: sensor domain-containing diguanylate cyclase [bacterium]